MAFACYYHSIVIALLLLCKSKVCVGFQNPVKYKYQIQTDMQGGETRVPVHDYKVVEGEYHPDDTGFENSDL